MSPITLYLVLQSPAVFIHMQLHCVQGSRYLSRYCNSQQSERSGDQILVRAIFTVHVQIGPGVHPDFYTMGTGSLPGVNGRGVALDTRPNLAPRLKKSRDIYLQFLCSFMAGYRVKCTFCIVYIIRQLVVKNFKKFKAEGRKK
jgi:hypothetical protein